MGNNTSYLPPYPSLTSFRDDSGSLDTLGPDERAWVLAALSSDPLTTAKSILENQSIDSPGLLLTRLEIAAAVDDLYSCFESAIAVDVLYIIALIEAIVDRGRINGERISEGLEQVVKLAARMVKGEACWECGEVDYQSPIRGATILPGFIADCIADLEYIAQRKGVALSMSTKTKYSLQKLCQIHEEFRPFQHLAVVATDTDELEEMWCHDSAKCTAPCWDWMDCEYHSKHCRPVQLEEWSDSSSLDH